MPSKRSWIDSVLAEVAALPDTDREDLVNVDVDLPPAAHKQVALAAKARRLSIPSFVRRAAEAMAAHDLGLPMETLTALDPKMSRDTGVTFHDPEMKRFRNWEIERLVGDERE